MQNQQIWSFHCRVLLASAILLFALCPAPIYAQGKAASDSDYLACHGQKDLKTDSSRSLFVDAANHKVRRALGSWVYGLRHGHQGVSASRAPQKSELLLGIPGSEGP
jgi:hypothetical protein